MISEQLEIIIQKAFELARNKKHEFLTLEHLLLELCDADDVKKFFSYKMVNIQSIKNDLNGYIEKKLKSTKKSSTTRSKFKKRRSSNFKYSSSNVFRKR